MSSPWMYRAFGQEFGPFSLSELKELVAKGMVTADSEIHSPQSGWVEAAAVSELGLQAIAAPELLTAVGSDPDVSTRGADDWFYKVCGLEQGPVAFESLLTLARTEQLGAEDSVKLGADGKWRRAGSIGRLVAVLPFQAPIPSQRQEATIRAADALTPARSQVRAAVEIAAPVPVKSGRTPAQVAIPGEVPKATAAVTQAPAASVRRTPAAEIPVPSVAAASSKSRSVTPASVPVVTAPAPVPQSDAQILRGIREALAARNLAGLNSIELDVRDGVVRAHGSLSSEGERLLAIRILEQADGVVRVQESLVVVQAARRVVATVRPTPVVTRRSRSEGPGVVSQVLEAVQGEYRNHAIAALVATLVLGFWFYPRGPVRPVAVHPVQGKVILDGQPLANAAIVLHRVGDPKFPKNLHPRGKATEDGTFRLETFDPADGAPDGEFVATVFLTEEMEVDGEKQAGPNVLPTVYSRPETSPLKLKITSATKELQPLELTKG